MEFVSIAWVALVVAWLLVGLGVAYVFGEFVRRSEMPEDADLVPKVSYLRRQKRATPIETRGIRRVAGQRRR